MRPEPEAFIRVRAALTTTRSWRCSVKSDEANGETLSYTLVCGTRTIRDATHYRGETSDGVKTTPVEGKTTSTQVKSRLLGACPWSRA